MKWYVTVARIRKECCLRVFILILCFFAAFLTSANAAELYRCVDQNGNVIVTDRPQAGMENCITNDADEEDSPADNKTDEENASADRPENNQEASDHQAAEP
ncbi:MAG TPA: DUF4124 domain-containing protein [Smithella sp.]|nr:DUF4124 domain-containing protein [Smithella sp.]